MRGWAGWYGGVFVVALYSLAFVSKDEHFVVGEVVNWDMGAVRDGVVTIGVGGPDKGLYRI